MVDTGVLPTYTRPRGLSEDTTMRRHTIGLLVILALVLLVTSIAAEAQPRGASRGWGPHVLWAERGRLSLLNSYKS
jgi:hypothetical protein